jgi:NAD(P) transhydrogenase subunit alpha
MRIAVPRETDAGEPRVAATPETIKKFKSLGAEVAVARGAGIAAGIPDAEFEAAGAQIADSHEGRRYRSQVRHPAQTN